MPFTCPLSVTVGHLRIQFHGEGHRSIEDRRLHIFLKMWGIYKRRAFDAPRFFESKCVLPDRCVTSPKAQMICVPSDDSHIIMTFRLVPLPTLGHFMRVLTKCFRSFFPAIIKLIKYLVSLGRSLYFINKIRHNFCCKTNKNLLNTK